MASYKVPQDVEADDKLLGPFSFRQFVYLIIVAVAIGLGWLLFTILPPLVILPLPVVVFFGALALPLRKDQPMEIYMAAILSFYTKPRKRFWDPDGIETLVQIAAPRNSEPQRTKNVSSSEAEQRIRYLSDLSDTHGWSVRGIHNPTGSSMNSDVFNEAQQTQDILDSSNTIAQNLDYMISQNDQRRHQETLNRFQSAAAAPAIQYAPPDPYAALGQTQQLQQTQAAPQPQVIQYAQPATIQPTYQQPVQVQAQPRQNAFTSTPAPQFNPYPTSMNQSIIQPLAQQQPAAPVPVQAPIQAQPATPIETTTSAKVVSPDIMKLASNADLSIETIAREAHRISEKEANLEDEEVIISLR